MAIAQQLQAARQVARPHRLARSALPSGLKPVGEAQALKLKPVGDLARGEPRPESREPERRSPDCAGVVRGLSAAAACPQLLRESAAAAAALP